MTDRLHRLRLALWAGTLAAAAVAAHEPSPVPAYPDGQPPEAPPPRLIDPAEPEPISRWLDEVRAQRRAWEERRQAAKEAIDARRRWMDPWGAAQREAREREAERRREAFRNQGPWGAPYVPWNEEPMSPGAASPASPAADAGGAPASPDPPLPGWDNRWYYRGY